MHLSVHDSTLPHRQDIARSPESTMSSITPNYSLFTIPAYMVLAMIPHAYSVQVITSNNNKKWNNASPRSLSNLQMVEKSVSKDVRLPCREDM